VRKDGVLGDKKMGRFSYPSNFDTRMMGSAGRLGKLLRLHKIPPCSRGIIHKGSPWHLMSGSSRAHNGMSQGVRNFNADKTIKAFYFSKGQEMLSENAGTVWPARAHQKGAQTRIALGGRLLLAQSWLNSCIHGMSREYKGEEIGSWQKCSWHLQACQKRDAVKCKGYLDIRLTAS